MIRTRMEEAARTTTAAKRKRTTCMATRSASCRGALRARRQHQRGRRHREVRQLQHTAQLMIIHGKYSRDSSRWRRQRTGAASKRRQHIWLLGALPRPTRPRQRRRHLV